MTAEQPSIRWPPGALSIQTWPRPAGMPSVFTAFVRSQQGEETPDADLFHDAWQRLRAVLASEMRKRGLWQSPPCYLGVYGVERWGAEEREGDPMARAAMGARASGSQVSALGELVADCYAFIFVDRMRSLKRQLEDKPDIEGLVLLNVRHFLHERQREHDPVGYRIFEILQNLILGTVAMGRLHVLEGDRRIRNDTVLGFSPAAATQSPAAGLAPLVVRWNDTLLEELVGARGRRRTGVVERLRERLLELPDQGIQVFRFRDLVDTLKSDARLRWTALLAGGGARSPGEGRRRDVLVSERALVESTIESRQSFDFLTRCVATTIRRIETDSRTRTHLSTLWDFLRLHDGAGDEAHAGPPEDTAGFADNGLPSHRELGRRLGIPRHRLPMLFTTLRQLVSRCRTASRTRLRARSLRQAGGHQH